MYSKGGKLCGLVSHTTVSVTSLVEERVRGEVVALRVCLFREEMRENGFEGEEWCLEAKEEERQKREGEKQRARFLASICEGRGEERVRGGGEGERRRGVGGNRGREEGKGINYEKININMQCFRILLKEYMYISSM